MKLTVQSELSDSFAHAYDQRTSKHLDYDVDPEGTTPKLDSPDLFMDTDNKGFKRVWDASCPREWDSWRVGDVTWVIRDLRPEDDELALKSMVQDFCNDEILCVLSGMVNDPVSMRCATEYWRGQLAQRMSLGCYEERDGRSELVALNVCYVSCLGDQPNCVIEGKAWQNFCGVKKYCYERIDPFKVLGVNRILSSCGLVVHKHHRGSKLASRILAAREQLALYHSILGTSSGFSSPAAQINAERAGFFTALTVTLKQLADAGLHFPEDENRSIKIMMKKYRCVIKAA